MVIARVRGTGTDMPAVLLYGHLDVKHAGPGWTSAPFRPVRRGGRLVARGASDDKGQFMAHLVAVQAWMSAGGPPCDVVVVVDGAEEIGSPGLHAALRRRSVRHLLGGPVAAVVVSDTRSAGPKRPSVTVSQRGMLAVTVVVDVGGAPLHSGRFGGAVLDPTLVLACLLREAAAEVTSWRDRVTPPVAGPSDEAVRAAAPGRATTQGPARRSTLFGALSVQTMHSGGTPGSVPTRATAMLDVRTPPTKSVAAARDGLIEVLRSARPDGVRIQVRCGPSAPGIRLRHPPQIEAAVRAACRAGYGAPPSLVASGASIPAIRILRTLFGVSPILLGLGPADDGAHGPDEYLDLYDWARGIDTMVVLLDRLAVSCTVGAGSHPGVTLGAHRLLTHDRGVTAAPCPEGESGHTAANGDGEVADVTW